jgi:hypothetical protein
LQCLWKIFKLPTWINSLDGEFHNLVLCVLILQLSVVLSFAKHFVFLWNNLASNILTLFFVFIYKNLNMFLHLCFFICVTLNPWSIRSWLDKFLLPIFSLFLSFLNFILIFKCYVPWHLSSYIYMYEVHMPYIEIFSILSCTIYPPIDLSLRQWEIYN